MLECTDNSFELLILEKADLSLGVLTSISILRLFLTIGILGLYNSLVVEETNVFTNSLLDTTIQDDEKEAMM